MATLRDLGSDPSVIRTEQETLDVRRPPAGPQPAGPAVHADLPVRRRRRTPGWRRRPGIAAGHPAAPATLSLGRPRRPRGRPAPCTEGEPVRVDARRRRPSPTCPRASGPSRRPQALVVPLRQQGGAPYGFLVAGLNRYRPLDDGYRGFVELAAGHLAAGHRQRPQLPGAAAAGRGARRAGPRQDRLLLQHQPRVPHPADVDHGAGGRAARPAARRRRAGPRGAGRHPPQRAAPGQAGQQPARLLPDRGGPDAGPLRAGRPGRGDRRPGQRLPVGDRARRPRLRGRLPAPARAGATSTGACGRRWCSTCSATR